MDEDLGLAERVGQLDRATAPGERLVVDSGQHGELGQVAVGHGQPPGRGQGLPAVPRPPARPARRRRCGPDTRQGVTASAGRRLACAGPTGRASSPAPAPGTRSPRAVGRSGSTRGRGVRAVRPAPHPHCRHPANSPRSATSRPRSPRWTRLRPGTGNAASTSVQRKTAATGSCFATTAWCSRSPSQVRVQARRPTARLTGRGDAVEVGRSTHTWCSSAPPSEPAHAIP